MNSELVASIATCLLVIYRVTTASTWIDPGFYYFALGITSIFFWTGVLAIADAVIIKEYIRGRDRYGTPTKAYKDKEPFAYYYCLFIAVAVIIASQVAMNSFS